MLAEKFFSTIPNFFRFISIFFFLTYFINIIFEKKWSFRKVMLSTIVSTTILAMLLTLCFELDDEGWLTNRSTILSAISLFIMLLLYPSFMLKELSARTLSFTIFLITMATTIVTIADKIMVQFPFLMDLRPPFPILVVSIFIAPILFLPFIWLVKRIKINEALPFFFGSKIRSALTLVGSIVFSQLDSILAALLPSIQKEYPLFFPLSILTIVLVFLVFIVFYQQTKEKISNQDAMLLQHQSYVHTLEEIQNDMRTLQHDYKNMISGLYLQAEAGESEKIKKYLNETLTQFDGNIGKKLLQTTQIKNIEIIELKSLVLAKLIEMEQAGLQFELEVLKPVKTVAMDMNNLNRCLGILLDNALEATKQLEHKEPIKLVVSSEVNDVTFIVKNDVQDAPHLQQIWKKGYSTKENNTGLGLFSLQQIIENYSNIMKQTRCEDGKFTQILTIYNT